MIRNGDNTVTDMWNRCTDVNEGQRQWPVVVYLRRWHCTRNQKGVKEQVRWPSGQENSRERNSKFLAGSAQGVKNPLWTGCLASKILWSNFELGVLVICCLRELNLDLQFNPGWYHVSYHSAYITSLIQALIFYSHSFLCIHRVLL